MGKKSKITRDEPELESELDPTTRVDGDSKKKKQKKKRSHDDPEMEPEQKMSLDGDAKKKKKKKSKNQEGELELEPEQTKIQEEEKKNDERPTVSIAIAGSIIHNTQSLELASRVSSLSLYSFLCFGFPENFKFALPFILARRPNFSCSHNIPNRRGMLFLSFHPQSSRNAKCADFNIIFVAF